MSDLEKESLNMKELQNALSLQDRFSNLITLVNGISLDDYMEAINGYNQCMLQFDEISKQYKDSYKKWKALGIVDEVTDLKTDLDYKLKDLKTRLIEFANLSKQEYALKQQQTNKSQQAASEFIYQYSKYLETMENLKNSSQTLVYDQGKNFMISIYAELKQMALMEFINNSLTFENWADTVKKFCNTAYNPKDESESSLSKDLEFNKIVVTDDDIIKATQFRTFAIDNNQAKKVCQMLASEYKGVTFTYKTCSAKEVKQEIAYDNYLKQKFDKTEFSNTGMYRLDVEIKLDENLLKKLMGTKTLADYITEKKEIIKEIKYLNSFRLKNIKLHNHYLDNIIEITGCKNIEEFRELTKSWPKEIDSSKIINYLDADYTNKVKQLNESRQHSDDIQNQLKQLLK